MTAMGLAQTRLADAEAANAERGLPFDQPGDDLRVARAGVDRVPLT